MKFKLKFPNLRRKNKKSTSKGTITKIKSIRGEITRLGLSLVLIPIFILGIITINLLKLELVKNAKQDLFTLTSLNSIIASSQLDYDINYLSSLSEMSILKDNSLNKKELTKFYNDEATRMSYECIGYINTNGTVTNLTNTKGSDTFNMDGIAQALSGGINTSQIYKDGSAIYINIYAPIKENGAITGLMFAVKDISYMDKVMDSLGTSTDVKDIHIVDLNGNIIFSTIESVEGSSLHELYKIDSSFDRDKAIASKYITFKMNGADDVTATYSKIDHTNWTIVSILGHEHLNTTTSQAKILFVIAFIIIIMVIAPGLDYLSRKITKPIKAITSRIEKISDLDVSQPINHSMLKYKDSLNELGIVARELLNTEKSISNFLEMTTINANNIKKETLNLKVASNDGLVIMNDISVVIDNVAEGMTSQAHDTENALRSIENMNLILERNIKLIANLVSTSNKIKTAMEKGHSEIGSLIDISNISKDKLDTVVSQLEYTNKLANDINNIVGIIEDIAGQTNMLALNAAIISAKSTDAGSAAGFSVIANSIRKLSNETTTNSKIIKTNITNLLKDINNVSNSMQEVSKTSNKQMNLLGTTNRAFEDIDKATLEAIDFISHISSNTTAISTEKMKIMDIMENLAAISEQSAASSEEMSASVQEQLLNLTKITDATETLNKNVATNIKSIEKFKY